MNEAALAPYVRHARALDWLNGLEIEKPVVACVGYNRVMQDARIIKAADAVRPTYQPVLLGMSESGGYRCAAENGLIGISCPNPELILRQVQFDEDDRLTAALELEAVLLAPIIKALRPKLIHAHDVMGLQCGALNKLWLQKDGHAAPLIYDSHEYVLGLEATPHGRAMAAMERRSIGSADGLITVSRSILEAIRRDYGYEGPARLAFNCPPQRSHGAAMPDLKTRLGLPAETPLGVWTGSVTFGTGAQTVIAALQFLPDLHLAFLTSPFGLFFRDLVDLAQRAGCADRVHVAPTVDFRVVPQAIVGADFGFVGFIPYMANHEFAMPNKFFEYLQGEVPLVVSNLCEMGSFVARHGIGEVFEAEAVASCASAIERVLQMPREHYLPRLKALAATYGWEYQASGIEDLYATVLERTITPATPEVMMQRRFDWLEEPDWLRVRAQPAAASVGLTFGGSVALPVAGDRATLRTSLMQEPAKLNAIFRDLDRVRAIAGDDDARILFDTAAGALADLLADPACRLVPSPPASGAGGDEPRLDLQLNLLQSLLLASRTMADAYTSTDRRQAATTTIRRLCATIAQNLCDRVERGGLTAGPPGHQFLLRSRWGAPANFSAHGRALRTLDRIATQLQSVEVAAVATALAASVENRLVAWSDELGDEFPVYVINLKMRRRRGGGKLQPSKIGFTLSSDAFTAYPVVPNRGLLGVRLRQAFPRRPALQLEVIDTRLAGDRERQLSTRLQIRLPPGYAVAASGSRISIKDYADRVVERPLVVEEVADGIVECRPDPGDDWSSMRQWRSDVVENSIVSGVSAAAAVFGLTRRSESYELMLCLARRAGERLGGLGEVESRLGWDLASVRKPLPLYASAP